MLVQLKSEQSNQQQNPKKQQNPRLPKNAPVSKKETAWLRGRDACARRVLEFVRPAGVLDQLCHQRSRDFPSGSQDFCIKMKELIKVIPKKHFSLQDRDKIGPVDVTMVLICHSITWESPQMSPPPAGCKPQSLKPLGSLSVQC